MAFHQKNAGHYSSFPTYFPCQSCCDTWIPSLSLLLPLSCPTHATLRQLHWSYHYLFPSRASTHPHRHNGRSSRRDPRCSPRVLQGRRAVHPPLPEAYEKNFLPRVSILWCIFKLTRLVSLADQKEFLKLCQAVGIGFGVMGAVGFVVKLSAFLLLPPSSKSVKANLSILQYTFLSTVFSSAQRNNVYSFSTAFLIWEREYPGLRKWCSFWNEMGRRRGESWKRWVKNRYRCVYFSIFSSLFREYEWDAIACLIDWFWDTFEDIEKHGRGKCCACAGLSWRCVICAVCVLVSLRLFDRECNRNESLMLVKECIHLHTSIGLLRMLGRWELGPVGLLHRRQNAFLLGAYPYKSVWRDEPSWCILFIIHTHLVGCVVQPPARCTNPWPSYSQGEPVSTVCLARAFRPSNYSLNIV